MVLIFGYIIIFIGIIMLITEIYRIFKFVGFTSFGGKFIYNLIFGLLTLALIVVGILLVL